MPKGVYPRRSVQDRFWAKVDKQTDDCCDCWLWTACVMRSGGTHPYGLFKVSEKNMLAHRVAYEMLVGPIPDGLVIDHLCRQTLCVNPAHMEPVSQGENVRRGWRARRAVAA